MDILLFLILAVGVYVFTTVVAMAGIGAAFILVPFIFWLGYPFNLAAAVGMFSNVLSTGSQSYLHLKNKTIDFRIAIPMIVGGGIFAPIGAILSTHVNENVLLILFSCFLYVAGVLILLRTINNNPKDKPKLKIKQNETAQDIQLNQDNQLDQDIQLNQDKQLNQDSLNKKRIEINPKIIIISVFAGSLIGIISGLLGVGGGSLILPLLLLVGLQTKRAASTTSFVVLFSSLTSFITRGITTQLNWELLIFVGIFTILGGYTGSKLMHFKLKQKYIKIVIILVLFSVATKILISHI